MVKTQAEAQARIQELEQKLGIKPTFATQADAQLRIDELNKSVASMPMTVQEFAEKRRADEKMPLSDKALAFGSTIFEGFKELGKQGVEATSEAEGLVDFDAYGDIINLGSRDFWRFAKTIGGSIMDEVYGSSDSQELVREYTRYLDNFAYYQKVRPAMLESDEIEYKKLTDFGANFIDPFMAFPVAKVATFGAKTTLKGTQKALTAGATKARSAGLTKVAKGARGATRAVQKLERGVDIAGKIGAYPTEMASRLTGRALRAGAKGTALTLGVGLKGVGVLGSGTAKVASAPRKVIEAGVSKLNKGARDLGGVTLGGQVVGGLTGSVPFAMELGITEGIGLIAKKLGKGAGEVLTTLAQPASNKRFLYRLATNSSVSPKTRKMAMYAYNHFGTEIGDALFNMMANGITIGGINAGLAGIAGEDAEMMGRAFGAGLLAGGIIPSGQQGMRAGKTDVARDNKSIDNHMKTKLTEDQRKEFKKMPKPAQVMLATLNEAGIGSPKFQIMESGMYLEMLNATLREQGKPELTKAPRGHYDPVSRTFFANKDKLPESSAVMMETIAHETGHDFVYQMLGNDPMMLEILLENYKTSKEEGTAFYYEFAKDEFGNDSTPIGEPIYLNQDAVGIRNDYDKKQRGRPATAKDVAEGRARREGEMIGGIKLGNNASKLAQEIGADQFAMMFTKDPNAFNNFHPKLRRYLIDASRKLLSVLGMAEPMTGNPLSNPVSRIQLNNPALRRLFENYGRARGVELDEKGQLAKDSVLIKPKDGQTGEDRFMEMMGGNEQFQSQGLSLTEAKNLLITNKSLRREINNIKKMYKEEPQDGWSVRRGRLFGKRLTPDLRAIFTRNDPFGNVATILDALQQAIDQGIGIVFGYRSGTKGKRQNPFHMRDVALYTFEVSANSLKVNGYNQAIVRHNIQVLVENGYIKDVKDFERKLAEQGQQALADPEGRINPDGGAENTLMTAVFGLKESAENIRSEGIKALLESGKLKKSYVSYDVEALAGLGIGRKKAFTFNYDNIRNNYSPFRQSDEPMFMPDSDLPPPPLRPDEIDSRRFASIKHLGLRDNILDGVLEGINQEKFSGQQFISAIGKTAGAKTYADDIGLTEFLNTKKSFTKDEIARFVKQETPTLEKREFSGLTETDIDELREDYVMNQLDNSSEFGWDIEEMLADDDYEDGFYIYLHGDLYNEVPYRTENDAYQNLEQIIRDDAYSISDEELNDMFGREEPESDGEAQYKEYTEDGGEEYKETLIRWDKDDGDDFYDPHYDGQDNTLLSIRSKIRRDDFGNKVLFLEEVQSDWHQQGRKEGYDNPALKGRLFGKDDPTNQRTEWFVQWEDGRTSPTNAVTRQQAESVMNRLAEQMTGGVPDAPFKKNWPALAMKVAIQDAMERGATRLAWLGGQGQINRYPSMVKFVDTVDLIYANDNRKFYDLTVRYKNNSSLGGERTFRMIREDQLPRYIGKPLAEKAIKEMSEKGDAKMAMVNYKGLDIEIGGAGMRNFYDKELVSIANKIGKKIGAGKVEPFQLGKIKGWAMNLPRNPVRVKSADNYFDLPLYMPDSPVSDTSIPQVVKEAAKRPKATPVVENEPMFMPALEDAKSIVAEKGRVAENAEDVFFGAMLPKLLRKTGGQLKPSVRNIREATRRAIEDVTPFLRDNPQFADYYNKDMEATRNELDQGYGNVSDDDFLFYRTMLGLTSPGTKLPSNVGDGVNIFNLYKEKGNLDDIKMGTSEKGNPVIASSPFKISGTTAPTKARSLLIVDSLRKQLGSVRDAIDFLEEGVPIKELHQFNKQMGYAGNVAKPGDIRRIVKQATGQDDLIPRMFIFGPKVGAYTLNAVGNHNYNTIDVWEARFIRSYFKGMFKTNTGLPANVDEHALFTRFTEIFQEEFEKKTGEKMPTSALQAIRWFYMIDTAKKLGYSGASTNETISGYTKRYVTKLRANSGGRGQGDGATNEGVQPQAQRAKRQSEGQAPDEIGQFMPDGGGVNRTPPTMPLSRFIRPAMTRAMATTEQLDRFKR